MRTRKEVYLFCVRNTSRFRRCRCSSQCACFETNLSDMRLIHLVIYLNLHAQTASVVTDVKATTRRSRAERSCVRHSSVVNEQSESLRDSIRAYTAYGPTDRPTDAESEYNEEITTRTEKRRRPAVSLLTIVFHPPIIPSHHNHHFSSSSSSITSKEGVQSKRRPCQNAPRCCKSEKPSPRASLCTPHTA